jgi:hypothetical protein
VHVGEGKSIQTFLPHPNFTASALCLDWRRLGKQRVEAQQIINCLQGGGSGGWANHPAVRMWEGCIEALMLYRDVCIAEWIRRGYENNMPMSFYVAGAIIPHAHRVEMPLWLGDDAVHSSHRANLIRKDPDHYGQFGWTETPVEGYHWSTTGDTQ